MAELIRNGVKVELVNIGEGSSGEYNADDPYDKNLLRFYVSKLDDQEWTDVEDASYCTLIDADANQTELALALSVIMFRVYEPVINGQSIKKICEELSWLENGKNLVRFLLEDNNG